MKHIVITGSTRGIGLGLAKEFCKADCKVTINGRTQESVEKALKIINSPNVCGLPGEVEDRNALEDLWTFAEKQFGKIDIWINNAGVDQERLYFWEMENLDYQKVIQTNLFGAMNGCHVAFKHMLTQGEGQIFNMEGFGSNGMMREKMTLYGTSKSAISYFTRSLALEAKHTPIMVGTLSPGMVATDFLKKSIDEEGGEKNKKIFNILADEVEPVTAFLAKKILLNNQNGATIEWLTKPKVAWRFLSSAFIKREVFK